MPILTRAEFASLCSVSRAAITKAVADSRLVSTPEGQIDTDHPVNASWMAAKKAGIRFSAPKTAPEQQAPRKLPKPPMDPRNHNIDDGQDEARKVSSLDAQKKRADIDLKRAQRDRHNLAIAEKKGELVPREMVQRRWATFDAALKSNLLDLPRRISARLHAVASAGTVRDVETELEKEIGFALKRTVDAATEAKVSE